MGLYCIIQMLLPHWETRDSTMCIMKCLHRKDVKSKEGDWQAAAVLSATKCTEAADKRGTGGSEWALITAGILITLSATYNQYKQHKAGGGAPASNTAGLLPVK